MSPNRSRQPVIPVREQLVALRQKRGFTQRQLADLVGVTQPVIADFETQAGTSLRLAMRVADALGAEIRVQVVEKKRRRAGAPRSARC